MQFDGYSFLAGVVLTLVLGFVFRRMLAIRQQPTTIVQHLPAQAQQSQTMHSRPKQPAKQLQRLWPPQTTPGVPESRTAGHVGKLVYLEGARERLSKKRSEEDEAG